MFMLLRNHNRPHRLLQERQRKVVHVQANTPDDAWPNEQDSIGSLLKSLYCLTPLKLHMFQGVQLTPIACNLSIFHICVCQSFVAWYLSSLGYHAFCRVFLESRYVWTSLRLSVFQGSNLLYTQQCLCLCFFLFFVHVSTARHLSINHSVYRPLEFYILQGSSFLPAMVASSSLLTYCMVVVISSSNIEWLQYSAQHAWSVERYLLCRLCWILVGPLKNVQLAWWPRDDEHHAVNEWKHIWEIHTLQALLQISWSCWRDLEMASNIP